MRGINLQILQFIVYSQKHSQNFFLCIGNRKNGCVKVFIRLFSKTTVNSALPDPKGPLVEEMPTSLISALNKEVLEILDKPLTAVSAKKKFTAYIKITPKKKVKKKVCNGKEIQ